MPTSMSEFYSAYPKEGSELLLSIAETSHLTTAFFVFLLYWPTLFAAATLHKMSLTPLVNLKSLNPCHLRETFELVFHCSILDYRHFRSYVGHSRLLSCMWLVVCGDWRSIWAFREWRPVGVLLSWRGNTDRFGWRYCFRDRLSSRN